MAGHFDLQLLQPQAEGFGMEAALCRAVEGNQAHVCYSSPSRQVTLEWLP